MLKIHVDTDIGGDIDDLCALALVLNWPGADLVAVTTNSDDRGRRAGYARYIVGLAGRADVRVAAGADIALACYGGPPYYDRPAFHDEARYWPEPVSPAPGTIEEALALLERSIEQGAVVVAIGALTNLALLERRSPGILREAKLCLMGGHVFPCGEGFPQWGYESDWNLQVDVQSARTVMEQSNPTVVPLSCSVQTALARSHLPRLKQSGPLGRLIARQAEAFATDNDYETAGREMPRSAERLRQFLARPADLRDRLGLE